MRYLSLCSGAEAASLAWEPLGWSPLAFAEVDPAPCAVLAHRWPQVPNLGDMTRYQEWPDAAIDVLVGGTPCQSFSVAGLRKGLADPRGNLMLTFGAIAGRYRPAWLVWENVPGVLSSGGGRDFGTFLGMLAELGYGFAYRVLDAQHFGVPQRRRRVFVVGHLGDWRRAAAVLFERHSLSGHPAPGRGAKEESAAPLASGSPGGGGYRAGPQVVGTISANGAGVNGADPNDAQAGHLIAGTVSSKWAKGTGGPAGDEHYNLIVHTLRGEGFDASEDGTGRGTPLVLVAFDWQSGGDARGLAPKGTAQLQRSQVPAIAYDLRGRDGGSQMEGPHDTANIRAASGGSSRSLICQAKVRRLTPRECERLQGMPDDHTLVPYRGKPMADGPRYRIIGNSMAVPVMRWIGERITAVASIGDPIRGAA